MDQGSVMRVRTGRATTALAAVAVLGIALTGCGAQVVDVDLPEQAEGSLPSDVVEQIEAATMQAMQASGATGAIVGVWAPWSGSYVEGIGTTGPDSDTPVTADMSFRIGDVTRAMTCDILYALDDEDVLSVDDPISNHVQSVANLNDVTLQQLCDSSSGLGDSESTVMSNWLTSPDRQWHPRELAAHGIVVDNGERGASYRPSDAGYLLLGQALTNATGRSAQSLIDDYIATPYALERTALPSARAAVPGDPYLPGYRSTPADVEEGCVAPSEVSESSSSLGGLDSGVVSTIHDLGRYAQILATASAQDESGRYDHPLPVNPDGTSWFQYGGGVFIAGPMIGQQGSTLGYASSVWADPATGLTVAVVLNNSRDATFGAFLGRQLASIASRAEAASGFTQPEIGLPWTAEGYDDLITERAICPIDSE